MYQGQNLLDVVIAASPGETNIHTFPQFKDWINNQFTIKTQLNASSSISRKSQMRPIKLKSTHSVTQSVNTKSHFTKRLSIVYNQLNQIQQNKEQLQQSCVPSAAHRSHVSRKASFGGDLGFDLRENSVMGSHSAQSSVSINGFEQINQYELTKLLGKGSFADVYLGIDTESEQKQKYAVKILSNKKIKRRLLLKKNSQILDRPPSPPSDHEQQSPKNQSLADMFVRNQVAILKKMSHQYITKLHDVIVDNQQQKVYLVLEYCDGGFINQSKNQSGTYKKLLESECKRYCKQLGIALNYIHNVAKIAHRDIKPENILLSEHDEVKISDFGLGTHKIKGKKSAGTPLYMPPENNKDQDTSNQAGDIWALGVTLLVLLTGRHPEFRDQKIDPALEMTKLTNISESCRDFIGCCLQVDQNKRLTAQGVLTHKWLDSEGLRQSMHMTESIIVTEQERAKVISDKQDKKGSQSPNLFKITVI